MRARTRGKRVFVPDSRQVSAFCHRILTDPGDVLREAEALMVEEQDSIEN